MGEKMANSLGCILDIQSIQDKKENNYKIYIYFKGCNIKCYWCELPEAVNLKKEIQYITAKCDNCEKCIYVCPQNALLKNGNSVIFSRDLCVQCGNCVEACDRQARIMAGTNISADEIIEEISFMQKKMGKPPSSIVLTGGEPLLQDTFIKDILSACKENNLHTTVVTSGNVAFNKYIGIVPFTDVFYYSIKSLDKKKHKKITDFSNNKVLNNIKQLNEIANDIVLSIPLLKEVNDQKEEIEEIRDFVKGLKKISAVELQIFNTIPVEKYQALGLEKPTDSLDISMDIDFSQLVAVLEEANIKTRVTKGIARLSI